MPRDLGLLLGEEEVRFLAERRCGSHSLRKEEEVKVTTEELIRGHFPR